MRYLREALPPILLVLAPFYAHAPLRHALESGAQALIFLCVTGDSGHEVAFSHRTWLELRRAWDLVDGPLSLGWFLTEGLWATAARSEALNMVHFALLEWPARAVLPLGPALSLMAVVTLSLNGLGGWWLGRSVGGTPGAGLCAGVVALGSGLAVLALAVGQYPQALLAPSLLFVAGLLDGFRGHRAGWILASVSLAFATLLYWYNGLLLGLLALFLLAFARPLGVLPPWRAWLPPALIAGLAAVVIAAPAMVPVVAGLEDVMAGKMPIVPYGTGLPAFGTAEWTEDNSARLILIDQVPPHKLWNPNEGWLMPLALVPLAAVGLRRRWGWAALLLAGVGILFVIGPYPGTPAFVPGPPGHNDVMDNYVEIDPADIPAPLFDNLFFRGLYQWLPLFSRMNHPVRASILALAGGAVLVATGASVLRGRWAIVPWICGLAGLWSVCRLGPLPLRSFQLSTRVESIGGRCDGIVRLPDEGFEDTEIGTKTTERASVIAAIHRVPTWPAPDGYGELDLGRWKTNPRMLASIWRLTRAERNGIDSRLVMELPMAVNGTPCVLLDTSESGVEMDALIRDLTAALGAPETIPAPGPRLPRGHPQQEELLLWVLD